jgi:alpha-beta hydrolase superfamily lysophospholipase
VLLVHGDDDRNVPFQQTTDLVEKLRAQKVAFEELIFPDEIHDLLRWSDWIRAYRATAEFFDRRLAASGERQYSRRISVPRSAKVSCSTSESPARH